MTSHWVFKLEDPNPDNLYPEPPYYGFTVSWLGPDRLPIYLSGFRLHEAPSDYAADLEDSLSLLPLVGS